MINAADNGDCIRSSMAAPPPNASPQTLNHPRWMRLAIESAQDNPTAPFGAVVVDLNRQQVVATGCNDASVDPTLHGEVDCLRKASAVWDVDRRDQYWLYTTAEPCPMCMAACVWAGLGGVVYGTSIATLSRLGFFQIDLTSHELAARSKWAPERVVGGVCEAECDALFRRSSDLRNA
ncbi:MAG: nucleoside deaminase [Planctomycetota bacterium]